MGPYEYMLYGVIVAEELIIALYFARFWKNTRDRLFVFLALGFVTMAIHRASLGYAQANGILLEQQTWFFVLRALSYVVILVGVIDKNLSRK